MTNKINHHETAGCLLLDTTVPEKKVLLIFRKWKHAPDGAYILPKGHVEAGEDARDAALRETVEETGYVDIEIIDSICTSEISYHVDGQEHQKTIHWFCGELVSEATQKIELTDTEKLSDSFQIGWYSIDDAIKKLESSPLDAEKGTLPFLRRLAV